MLKLTSVCRRWRERSGSDRRLGPHGLVVTALLLWSSGLALAAPVTNLQVAFRKGQTFITFREVTGSVTYSVYRSTSPIASVAGLTPIAVLPQGSGVYKYTGQGFIVTDLGTPLAAGTGLLVYTTSQNGTYYYAVTNSQDATISAGVNATMSGLAETVWVTPGAVQIRAPYAFQGYQITEFFAWDDYASWDPAWGYYGSRFDVGAQTLAAGQTYPLTLQLHGAGMNGYREPDHWVPQAVGVHVFPVDLEFSHGMQDPYTGSGRPYAAWFGYPLRTVTPNIAVSAMERRVLRFVRAVQADPRYQVDATRIYVSGGSMGGGGSLHIAMHNPTMFAAAEVITAWVDTLAWGDWSAYSTNPPVDSPSGPLFRNWQDAAWVVDNTSANLPPLVHTFSKNDTTISMSRYPNLLQRMETRKFAQIAVWRDTNHTPFMLSGANSFRRFRKNEAYPAFAAASSSTPFDATLGQRNQNIDWSSSLRSLGAGTDIVDLAGAFGMTFKSLTTDATADVTIRNTQQFRPRSGESVTWRNETSGGQVLESGTMAADAQGLVTIRLRITAAGNRLTLTCPTCVGSFPPPNAPQNVRVIR
jgi:dienelactone hydrolase